MVERSESPPGLFGDAIKAAAHRTRTGTAEQLPVTGISHGHEGEAGRENEAIMDAWPEHLLIEGKNLAAGEAPPAFS
jgi:hypothetical protein